MALTQLEHDADRLFVDEQIYQSEMTISDLIHDMKELNIGKKPVYADHAAPDKITDLRRAGFNIHPADKDVKNGIDFIKRKKIYITKRSKGIISEIIAYKWKVKDDITLDVPVKFKDDGMDSMRYGAYTGFRRPSGLIVSNSNDLLDDDTYLEYLEE